MLASAALPSLVVASLALSAKLTDAVAVTSFGSPFRMNRISPELLKGTIGELLVQLRLLQFGVQAAAPIKDSGNDLIAVRRSVFQAIQVKTHTGVTYKTQNLPEHYHLLAVVELKGKGHDLWLDRSRIFLIPKESIRHASRRFDRIQEFSLTQEHVDRLFSETESPPRMKSAWYVP